MDPSSVKPFFGLYAAGFSASALAFYAGWKRSFWIKPLPIWGMAFVYLALLTAMSYFRHFNFHSNAYDLGLFRQVLENAAQGRGLDAPLRGHHFFGDHIVPILYLLVPLYRLFPTAFFLLFLQSAALSSGGLLLFFYARRFLSESVSALLALSYFLHPVVLYANLFEFHPDVFAVPLFLLAFYFLPKPFSILFLLLASACKEYFSLHLVPFAWLFLRKRKKGEALFLFLFGIGYFLFCLFFLIPHFNPEGFVYSYMFSELGESPGQQLVNLLTHPWFILKFFSMQFLGLLLFLLLPLLFFPLSNIGFLLALPSLLIHMASRHPLVLSPFYHHNIVLIPFLYAGLCWGWKFSVNKKKLASGFFWLSIVFHLFFSPSPLSFSFWLSSYKLAPFRTTSFHWSQYFQPNPRALLYREALKRIPENTPVCVPGEWIPHLKTASFARTFPLCAQEDKIIAFDIKGNPYPVSKSWYLREAKKWLRSDKADIVMDQDQVVVLRKK